MWETLAQIRFESNKAACGPIGVFILVIFLHGMLLVALFHIGQQVKRIADHLTGELGHGDSMPRPLATAQGIPVENYARMKGKQARHVIEEIRQGKLRGFVRDGEWFVEE
jgi:hypothetical protein